MKNPYEILNFIRIFVLFSTNKPQTKLVIRLEKN